MIETSVRIDIDVDRSISERFDAVTRSCGSSEAVRADARVVTYEALASTVDRIAQALIEAEFASGDRAGLFFETGVNAVAALLGVLKAGGIAVPLTPSHPAARVRQILSDSAPAVVLTDRAHTPDALALSGAIRVIDVDGLAPAARREWPQVHGSAAALILYTSGSTGTPKGIVQTHRSVLHKIGRVAPRFGTTTADRFTMFGSYAVGQGITSIFSPLLYGATLCPFNVRRHGMTRLAEWLASERITVFLSSATLFRAFARSIDSDLRFPELRLVRIGGERVTAADVAAFRRICQPPARMIVSYSATESGPITTHAIGADETFPEGVVPIGTPVSGIAVLILDEAGRERAAGEEGEIAVRSAFLPPGAWRGPTALKELCLGATREQIWRTGDLGRFRADGCLEHLGRKDFRVKIRGFRIELEEIESALIEHADIVNAAVAARPDAAGDMRLIGYVQPRIGTVPTVDELRAHLGTRLPDYMVPSTFVVLDALPLTDAGKPDRAHLPEPNAARTALVSTWSEPRTPTEDAVARIWREVLHLEHVGVSDAFFSIGGDSLKATQVAARLASAFGRELPPEEVLTASTVAELAAVVDRYRR